MQYISLVEHGRTVFLDDLNRAAYEAVDARLHLFRRKYPCKHELRAFNNLWAVGHRILLHKRKHHPIVVARNLVMYYLRFEMGQKMKDVADVFNVNHTSAMCGVIAKEWHKKIKKDELIMETWAHFNHILAENQKNKT